MSRIPLVYVLHSGNLYGTERMAIATVRGLQEEFEPLLLAPDGPALAEAARLGIATQPFGSPGDLLRALRPVFAAHRTLRFVATGLVHSLACRALQLAHRNRVIHLHLVHGGASERLSYGRKRWLNRLGVTLVAVSPFVRTRLLAHGVRADRIAVVENFLPTQQVANAVRRPPFTAPGLPRVLIVSRVDPIKRLDLLLAALGREPRLAGARYQVLGTGADLDRLRSEAARAGYPVTFAGFSAEVAATMAMSDLLLHLCPEEPFGLAILEAMAAGLPVLVPDRGGAGDLIEDGANGFRFRADDPEALAARLLELQQAPPARLNAVVRGADEAMAGRFSESRGLEQYRTLLAEVCR